LRKRSYSGENTADLRVTAPSPLLALSSLYHSAIALRRAVASSCSPSSSAKAVAGIANNRPSNTPQPHRIDIAFIQIPQSSVNGGHAALYFCK
jgi:hypothetical protein